MHKEAASSHAPAADTESIRNELNVCQDFDGEESSNGYTTQRRYDNTSTPSDPDHEARNNLHQQDITPVQG